MSDDDDPVVDPDGWPAASERKSRQFFKLNHVVGITTAKVYTEEEERKLHAEQAWFRERKITWAD